MSQLPIWTPLATVLLALTWLLPNASPPWPSFHKDAWAAFIFLCITFGFLLQSKSRKIFLLDLTGAFLILVAGLTACQWYLGLVYFSGHAIVGISYFIAGSLAIMIGRSMETEESGRVGDVLFPAFWLAAMVTSGLMLAQWLMVDANEVWINPLPSWGRPSGNLAQPNNAATLLLLGLVSLLWFGSKNKLRLWLATLNGVYLVFFLALTGSRIGYLALMILLAAGLVVTSRKTALKGWRPFFLVILVAFPVCVGMATYNWGVAGLDTTTGTNPFNTSSFSIRLALYTAFSEAAVTKPWMGFGFLPGAKVQETAHYLGYELPGLFIWAHNAFLDLAVWFGLPIVLLGLLIVVFFLLVIFSVQFVLRRAVYFAAISVIFIHGMVELPLGYAYFLLPFCFLIGAVTPEVKWPSLTIPIFVPSFVAVALSLVLALLIHDYLRIEAAFYTWRFKTANVGRNHVIDLPETWILNQQLSLIRGLRSDGSDLTLREVQEFREAVVLAPSAAAMQHLAEVQMQKGDVESAQATADMAYILTNGKERRHLADRWKYLGATRPDYRKVIWRGN